MERLTRKTNGKDYCSYCHQVEFDNEILERKDDIIEPQDFYNKYPYQSIGNEEEILNKLGAIEDLEEQLGIDLITLFKALKEGVWFSFKNMETESFSVKYKNKKHHIIPKLKFYNGGDKINWYLEINHEDWDYCYHLYPEDYGKTWWLEKPKGELENE